MQRYILFVLFLCLQWVAQGQTDYEYRYWFDKDEANMQTGTFTPGSLHLDVDLSTLDASLHMIHIQVKDSEGEWSSPVSRYFVRKATALTPLVYWLDNQVQPSEMSAQSGHFDLDVSALDDGLHFLRLQLSQLTEGSSSPVTRFFIKTPIPHQTSLLSWIDDDHKNVKKLEYNGGKLFLLDVSEIADGFHVLYLQAMGKGGLSVPTTKMFIKIPQTEGVSYLTCACSVDGKLFKTEQVSSKGGVVNWNLDVASLSQGIHNLQVQVLTPTGAATNVSNHFFFRAVTQQELSNMKLVYSLDGNEFHSATGDAANGVFHFDVDVASLKDGLHRIIYQLASESGASTKVNTSFFWKTPIGGNGITEYRYWLNDNEANAQVKVLDKRVSPFSLVTLLPVDSEPIRSSCFQFEVKDGVPLMYAKNDFHIVFYDASTRRVDETRQFVDYNVSQKVEDIADLQATQTFTRPEANTVKWYKFEGEKGDTVAFRSSQAMSLQLFAPSGKELYSTSADRSVKYDGCHIWEDGTYYVAVHDVTGTRPNVSLDFMHMDRYDVVAQDVHTVGNGGCSSITFQGNGFDELESVTLISDNEILCDSITHTSNVDVSVHFDFTGSAVGNYDAIFQYKEGIKRVNNCLTIEEAKPITIDGKVTFDAQYLRSRNNDYVIKLTNHGNSTAYDVPLAFGIFTINLSDLNYVDIEGVDYYAQLRNNLPQLFTQSFCDSINLIMQSHGALPLLVKKDSIDYIDGFPAMHKAVMTVDLQPNTTKTVTIALNTSNKAFLYVWYPSDWQMVRGESQAPSILRATVIDDANCGFAKEKANQCAQNELLIEYDMKPIYDVDCTGFDPSKICPPPPGGGGSTPVNSLDPNDIYGYTSESGSKYLTDLIRNVNYRVEFENDPIFATASAHVVEIKDTLDSKLFDLTTFAPTSIKIGDKTEYLDGSPNFLKTIDMRPAINAITQIEGKFDQSKGIATWTFTSLDPMTMEPTDDVMQGFLPVNYDGVSGIGEVAYNISLKDKFADGTVIPNRAGIVFDSNETIMTPLWTNTVDAVSPASQVVGLERRNDSILTIRIEGDDERSGIWKYEVYAQYGKDDPWWKIGECPADTAHLDFRYYHGIDYGFCVLATDSAGNVESKELAREASIQTYKVGDVNGDDVVNTYDMMLVQSKYLGEDVSLNANAADVNEDGVINTYDAMLIQDIYLSTTSASKLARTLAVRKRKQILE
ncbi:MAG: dockerin type I repeat-containing protein [Prevotella sp.]|nr:dockerin type I repeat-containing protein [Prevotella sp.]